jgi:hypothetical protein
MTQRTQRLRRARLRTEALEQRLLLAVDTFSPNLQWADGLAQTLGSEYEPSPVQDYLALLGSQFPDFTSYPGNFSSEPNVLGEQSYVIYASGANSDFEVRPAVIDAVSLTTSDYSSIDFARDSWLTSFQEYLTYREGVLSDTIPGSTFTPAFQPDDQGQTQPTAPQIVDRPNRLSFENNVPESILAFEATRGLSTGDATAGINIQHLHSGDRIAPTSLLPTLNVDAPAPLTVAPTDLTGPVVLDSTLQGSLNDPVDHGFSDRPNLGLGTDRLPDTVEPTFEVVPNRGITPPPVDEPVSPTEPPSFATIDIASNRMTDRFQSNSLAEAKQAALPVESFQTPPDANGPRFAQSAVVSFRVEPIMARHHHIDIPRQTVASVAPIASHRPSIAATPWTFEVTTIDETMMLLQNQLTADIMASLLVPEDVDTGGEGIRTVATAAAESVVPPVVSTEQWSIRNLEENHSNWQMAIDVLMAGVAGAVIYSGQYQDRRHRDGELEPS